ncbi:DUF1631 domain-containing protein [Aurantivibrio plasticivorans]
MSDTRNDPNRPHLHAVGQFPEAKAVEHLKHLQKVCADHCEDVFMKFFKALDEKLLEFADGAKTNQEATKLQETVREFRINGKNLKQFFITTTAEGFVKFKNKKLNTRTGEEKYRGDMLSLVDNEDLEETIAISSVARRAEEAYGEELWCLNQRFAVLINGETVQEYNNPVSPIQFCEALRKGMQKLSIDTKSKIIAYKIFDNVFIARLKEILDDVNRYFINQEILPGITRSTHAASDAVDLPLPGFDSAGATQTQPPASPQSNPRPVNQGEAPARPPGFAQALPQSNVVQTPVAGGPTEQYQGQLVDAIRTLQNHIAMGDPAAAQQGAAPSGYNQSPGGAAAPNGVAPSGAGTGAVAYSNQQLVTALQTLQGQALSNTAVFSDATENQAQVVTPIDINAASQQLTEQLKEESKDGELDGMDMHTIELVGMLFEYMLSDENLPDSIKAILSYLHTPFLKVAFLDSSFFEKAEHPARLLLNSLAEAGSKWVSNDGSSQYEIYTKVKQIVSRVLEDFEKDVRLFAELLLEFSSYVKKISRRQDLMEKRALEKVQGEEKLREVKIRVNNEVRSRTDGKELPSAILLLLLQPWSDYLAFLLLRYGDESELWQKALKAIDDVLWSIQPKTDPKEKAKQMDLHDDLLDVIENGFETIGYDQTKGKKLVEAVLSLQEQAMQSRKVAPAPEPEREELEAKAAEKAGHVQEPEEKPTPEEEKMVENLKMIEFGTWFEFDGGKRLKVAWYNSKTMHYMLVDQMGKKVAMKSGLALARMMLSGEAKVIAGSTKPFFERALENIFQSLNARAEAVAPEK